MPLAFAVLVVLLFSVALGGAASKLAPVAAPVIWVTVLLSGFLSLEGMFRPDAEDGTLDQWLCGSTSMVGLMIAKATAHWLMYGLGLTLAAPLLAMLLKLPADQLPILLLALAIGTLGATQIGLIAAALTARLRRSGILLAIIVMPLFLPLLIFGSGAVDAVRLGDSPRSALLLLCAQSLLLLTLAPLAAAAGLKIGSDSPP